MKQKIGDYEISELQIVDITPGSVVVFRVVNEMSNGQLDHYKAMIEHGLGNIPFVILRDGIQIEAVLVPKS
ncbi:MAG: hypothetical protein KDI12_25015 [Anaerolineae bacterium]|nr:hypothetical protein [Anaerolineae bacterium]